MNTYNIFCLFIKASVKEDRNYIRESTVKIAVFQLVLPNGQEQAS